MRTRETKNGWRLEQNNTAACALAEQDRIIAGISERRSSTAWQSHSGKPDKSPQPVQPASKGKTLPKLKNSDNERETVLRLIRRIKEQQA